MHQLQKRTQLHDYPVLPSSSEPTARRLQPGPNPWCTGVWKRVTTTEPAIELTVRAPHAPQDPPAIGLQIEKTPAERGFSRGSPDQIRTGVTGLRGRPGQFQDWPPDLG
jgi:hypothetical protein